MNKKKIISALMFGSLIFGIAGSPVLAQSSSPVPTGARLQQREQNLQQRAAAEITARIDSLNKIAATLNAIKKISSSDKSALLTQVQTEISSLQALQSKIQGDTDITTLKADVGSISKAFRVYWLFLPKIHILASADRINDIATKMLSVAAKLQTRINAGGSSTASLQTTLNDATSKINDAKTQAQNAINLVSALQPDNGDNNVLASNVAALKSARNDIQTANKDLKAAYADFRTIAQTLRRLRKSSPSPAS